MQNEKDLAAWAEKDQEWMHRLLSRLCDGPNRILVPLAPQHGQSGARYQLYHDVLAKPVLEWRAKVQHEQELEQERTAKQKPLFRLGASIALALLGLVLVAVAISYNMAHAQQEKAYQQQMRAENAAGKANEMFGAAQRLVADIRQEIANSVASKNGRRSNAGSQAHHEDCHIRARFSKLMQPVTGDEAPSGNNRKGVTGGTEKDRVVRRKE